MTSDELTVTPAASDDPRVLGLVRDLDADLAARYPGEPCTGGSHIHPGIRFLLAEVSGRPVGCCAVQPFPLPDTAAELKRMYVIPQARGRGVAARLLSETALVLDSDGTWTARYDKQMLFRTERDVYRPGDHGLSLDIDDWRLGLGVC